MLTSQHARGIGTFDVSDGSNSAMAERPRQVRLRPESGA